MIDKCRFFLAIALCGILILSGCGKQNEIKAPNKDTFKAEPADANKPVTAPPAKLPPGGGAPPN